MQHEIPYRKLGKTGEMVSIIGLGGFHIGLIRDHGNAINLIRRAIDSGINFMDNCWDYHQGESERIMGEALKKGYRNKVFLMTKIDGRTKNAAKKQIDQSLSRLQVEHIDLLQLHEVIRMDDPDLAFSPGGAMDAIVEARDTGKIRFIGFTGHKNPAIHLKMLEQDFEWDTVQMPLNVLDVHYESFQKKVLPILNERNIGCIGMKPFAAGELFDTHTVTATEALHYVMSLPVSVIVTGLQNQHDLDQAIQAATTFVRLSDAEIDTILEKTAPIGKSGVFEPYKTTIAYDSTTIHPEWLSAA
ncbi:MAG: aldo/keto reductase [Firmicutes bacterium]|nr:aldo/keto reductase [Bacillota bacterium]